MSDIQTQNVNDDPNKQWREYVLTPETLPEDCQDFLDTHSSKGKVSRAGLLELKESIGVSVPYQICPRRVKKILRMITDDAELPRGLFKTKVSYQSALCNLYIYGYMRDVDQTLIAARNARLLARKRWGDENPEKMKKYAENANAYRKKWFEEYRRNI